MRQSSRISQTTAARRRPRMAEKQSPTTAVFELKNFSMFLRFSRKPFLLNFQSVFRRAITERKLNREVANCRRLLFEIVGLFWSYENPLYTHNKKKLSVKTDENIRYRAFT